MDAHAAARTGAPDPAKGIEMVRPLRETGPGHGFVGVRLLVAVTAVLLIELVFMSILLVIFWIPPGTQPTEWQILGMTLSRERVYLITVMLAGAIGSMIHVLRSLYWYTGNRQLRGSWLSFYLCLPFVGSSMGLVFYFVLRGGLFTSTSAAGDVNIYGFAAVSALVGLFSAEAAEKLEAVFNSLFTHADQGADHVAPAYDPGQPPYRRGGGRAYHRARRRRR